MRRVLFLCTANSARSPMAEAIVNARHSDRWEAHSAGTRPAAAIHPLAAQALEEIGVPARGLMPKPLEAFRGHHFDLVLTVCDAAAACPVWPGPGERLHLGFPDPAAAGTLAAFRAVRDELILRLGELLGR